MGFSNKKLLKNDKYLYYNVLNGRDIQIYSPNLIHEIDKNNTIVRIYIPHVYELKIGETYEYLQNEDKKIEYDINYIVKSQFKNNTYILSSHMKNQTTLYLLPTLNLLPINKDIKAQHNSSFILEMERFGINTYLINAYLNKKEKILKLLYKFSSWEGYINLESQLKNHKNFLRIKDEDHKYVSVYFSIPEKYYDDTDKFINGEYSQFSNDLKRRIMNFTKLDKDKSGAVKGVLTKDPELKLFIEDLLDVELEDNNELDEMPNKEDYYG